jgi:hypothetical protein
MGSVMPGSSGPNRNNSWRRTGTVFISRPAFVTFAVASGRISTDMSACVELSKLLSSLGGRDLFRKAQSLLIVHKSRCGKSQIEAASVTEWQFART